MVLIKIEFLEAIIFSKSNAVLLGRYTNSCIVIIVVLL
jgi:hypothetical protein